jgi:hypothetical protein
MRTMNSYLSRERHSKTSADVTKNQVWVRKSASLHADNDWYVGIHGLPMLTWAQVGTSRRFNAGGNTFSSSRGSGLTASPVLDVGGTVGPHGQYGHAISPCTPVLGMRNPNGGQISPALSAGSDEQLLGRELSEDPYTMQGKALFYPD